MQVSEVRRALEFIRDTFRRDEGQGFRSRDRQFAISIADRALQAPELDAERLANGIRAHRDFRGDDRCWRNDTDLYGLLPEGYEPPHMDTAVELERCQQFIACRENPATVYVSPQRRIEELEAALRSIADSHKSPAVSESSLVVALQRWSACVETAKRALGLPI